MIFSRLIPSLLVAALAAGVTAAPAEAQAVRSGVKVEALALDGINYDAATGLLTATGGTATGTIAGLPFTTDVENFAVQLLPDGDMACSVLNIELGPIDVDLLGLHVDTSPICLTVTAFEGEGLLGDLLCGLAGGDLDLLDGVLAGLPDVLNESMAQAQPGDGGAEDICDGECEILDLAIGPVDLTLLGLNVHLDDCEDGPVQVCVSASEGEGLLGDLLCGLAGGGVLPDLDDLEGLIGAIFAANDFDLTPKQLDKVVNQASRLLRDGELSTNDIAKLTRTIQKLVRKA